MFWGEDGTLSRKLVQTRRLEKPVKCEQEMRRAKLESSNTCQRVLKLMGHLNVLQVGSREENWEELSLTVR